MQKLLLLIAGLLLIVMAGKTQPTAKPAANDTANFPYWVQMMQDPDANFFKTQRAFNLYWKDRKITRGCGWKVFKRWEYMMQSRILPDGSRPPQDAIFNAYNQFQPNSRSANGSWVSLGPADIPAPGPAGYEGLGRINVVAFHPTNPDKFYIGAPSGGMWQTADGGTTWTTHTDTIPTLGVSAIVVDYANPEKILIGTGDRDAGDAPGMGVFKSMDGGLTWTPSKTGMNNKTVGRIIQHPTDSQIFLAATGGGVYRSTDGGATWVNTKSGGFQDIQFKPDDPNTVYAIAGPSFFRSTNNGVSFSQITSGLTGGQRGVVAVTSANPNYVYFLQSDNSSGFQSLSRSTDAGLTFTTRSTSPNILDWSCNGTDTGGQGWYDLALAADPNNAETIYVGGVNVWKSTNGGTTWVINSHWYGGCSVPAVHADCHFLTFSPVNGKLYATNDGGCWSTTNGGSTWTDHTVGMTIGQIYKLGQSQTVKNKVINGFQDNGTYGLTPDGWIQIGGGDGMECAIDYTDASYTYHTVYYGDIYRRINNADETHIAGNGVNGITEGGAWVTPFCLSAADHKGMFAGYKNIWRSFDVTSYPVTWTKISDNLAGNNSVDMAAVENSPANPNILYVVRSDDKFFRTDNCLGSNPLWMDMTMYLPASGTITSVEANPEDENIVYISRGNGIYKSSDKGKTWTNITGNLPAVHPNTIVYYRNAPEGLYVGTDAGVYYKDQASAGWIAFSLGLPANGRITELEIYYDNDSISQDVIRASSYGRGLWGSDLYHTAPHADFTTANTTIPVSCPVGFTDSSTGVPTFFQWTFQGGTPFVSNQKNPVNIVYNTPGLYQVKLKVWNEFGSDSITKLNYMTVSGTLLPVVDFVADKFVLCNDNIVHFTDQTTNCPISWSWQFSPNTVTYKDGTSNASQNPVVQFDAPGPYNVVLNCYSAVGGPVTATKLQYIVAGGYALPFEESFADGFGTKHWEIQNPDLSVTWDTISVAGTVPGSKAVWMNFFNYTLITHRDQLISPALDFIGYGSVVLSFRHAYEQRVRIDSLIIKVSQDCGTSWERIWAMGPNGTPYVFVTHQSTGTAFYPQSSDDWCGGSYGVGCYSIDLTPWAGNAEIKLMFESYAYFGNNLFLNDIRVNGTVGVEEYTKDKPLVSIYPNPNQGQFILSIRNGHQKVAMDVINLQGQIVRSDAFLLKSGTITQQLDFSGFPKGIYHIRLTDDSSTQVKKLVIE